MREATPKERMLKKIRRALIEKTDLPYPKIEEQTNVFSSSDEILEIQFAEEFSKVNGHFIFCEDKEQSVANLLDLINQKKWKELFCFEKELKEWLVLLIPNLSTNDEQFTEANVGITTCDALIARTGSILISSGTESGRRLSIYPNIHIVIAYTSQLCLDINAAMDMLLKKNKGQMPSMISTTTGPSRTADIEKTLVLGAHGPKEIYLLLIDDQQ